MTTSRAQVFSVCERSYVTNWYVPTDFLFPPDFFRPGSIESPYGMPPKTAWELEMEKRFIKAQRLAKRTRAASACIPCKAKKTRCSDYRPCARCKNCPTEMCRDVDVTVTAEGDLLYSGKGSTDSDLNTVTISTNERHQNAVFMGPHRPKIPREEAYEDQTQLTRDSPFSRCQVLRSLKFFHSDGRIVL